MGGIQIQHTPIKRLLIVKTSSIGDVIHALPIASIIKEAYPDIRLSWVVRHKSADVLGGNPWIDRLIIVPDKPSIGDLIGLRRDLLAESFDTALDMQGLLLSGVITWLSGARRRIGLDLDRERNKLFLTEPIVPASANPERHAIDILRGFLPPIGINANVEWSTQKYLSQVEIPSELRRRNRSKPLIAINPGASSIFKQWPVERWIELCKKLLDHGDDLVLTGGSNDISTAQLISSEVTTTTGSLINLAGKTSLRVLGGVLSVCDLMITPDTGPMHLSAAVGTPTIALFGSTNPIRTGPYGADHAVICRKLTCAPCYRNPTCQGRVDCMKAISADEVLSKVCEILRAKRFG